MNLELEINGSIIDIDSETLAPLTYSIADIKSPNKRSRNRSKTVTIKGTQRNLATLYPTYNLSLKDEGVSFNFNPNSQLTVRMRRNGYVIFNGVANFLEVNLKKGVYYFDFLFVGNTISLFEQLGDLTLDGLGWSEYDHAMTIANYVLSWDTSVDVDGVPTSNFTGGVPDGFGYLYPLVNYGYSANQLTPKTKDLLPLFYVRELMTKCFAVGGYTIIGDWIDSNLTKRTVINNGGGNRITANAADIAERQVNYTITGTNTLETLATFSASQPPIRDEWWCLYQFRQEFSDITPFTTTLANDDLLQFDEATGLMTCQAAGNYHFEISLDFDLSISPSVGGSLGFVVQIEVNGGGFGQSFAIGAGAGNVTNMQINKFLNGGDEVRFVAIVTKQGYLYTNVGDPAPTVTTTFTLNSAYFDVTSIDNELTEGDIVELAGFVPKMKCRDFLNGMIILGNLYLSDPNDDNEVRIETFSNYYNTTDTAENYTMLMDIEKNINIKTNAGIDGKLYKFRWTEDMDAYKQLYFDRWNSNYGDLDFEINATFVKGEKIFEVPFAQTVPIQVSDCIVPQIVTRDETTGIVTPYKGKPRLFIYNGLQLGDWSLLNTATSAATPLTSYPQVHHVNDVVDPTFDLNFGVPIEIYYDTNNYTSTNLYSEAYDTFLKELTSVDSKMLTAYFKIDESNLQGEFMRELVNINGVVYRKNLISDFDATGHETTKHELIKVLKANKRFTGNLPRGTGIQERLKRISTEPLNSVKVVAVSYTVTRFDESIIVMNTTLANRKATLSTDMFEGMEKTIAHTGGFVATVESDSGLISGQAFIYLTKPFESRTFVFLSGGWYLKENGNILTELAAINQVETITGDTTTEEDVATYLCDTTLGDITLTLSVSFNEGKAWNVKKISPNFKVIIEGVGGATIDGSLTAEILMNQESLTIQFDNTNFNII